jgi:hypothetical protein
MIFFLLFCSCMCHFLSFEFIEKVMDHELYVDYWKIKRDRQWNLFHIDQSKLYDFYHNFKHVCSIFSFLKS